MKNKLLLLITTMMLIGGLYWFATHAYIEITIENAPDKSSYSLLNQRTQKSITGEIRNQKVRKLVRRDSYEIYYEDQKQSGLVVVRAGGFLGTTKATIKPGSEHGRSFVGENPNTCMYPVADRLLSAACESSFDRLKSHTAATATVTTTAIDAASSLGGLIEGHIVTQTGTYIIVKTSGEHSIYQLGPDGSTSNQITLGSLKESVNYAITPYQDGFIAYSLGNNEVIAYENIRAEGNVLKIDDKLKVKGLSLKNVIARGSSIGLIYSDAEAVAETSFDSAEGAQAHTDEAEESLGRKSTPKTVVVIKKKDSKIYKYDFGVGPLGVTFCADDRLCTIADGTLSVFNISGKKAMLDHRLTSVSSVARFSDKILAIRNTDTLIFNPKTRSGHVSYKFGNYAYCGIATTPTKYVLCVANDQSKRSALLVDTESQNIDDIDQKLIELQVAPYVKQLSVYGSYIYVQPSLGDVVFNSASGSFEYDPAVTQAAKASINETINKLGIDRSRYTITINAR